MAKRRSKSTGVENTIVTLAEDLGRIVGTAERKANEWLNQRQVITDQLTIIRDKASSLLAQFGTSAVATVSRRRGRPPGRKAATATATTPSARAPEPRRRRKMTAAQRKAVGLRMKKYWAERRKAAK